MLAMCSQKAWDGQVYVERVSEVVLFRVGCILNPFSYTCKALTALHWPLQHVQLGSLVPKMKSTPNACRMCRTWCKQGRMYVWGRNKTVTDIHTYIHIYIHTNTSWMRNTIICLALSHSAIIPWPVLYWTPGKIKHTNCTFLYIDLIWLVPFWRFGVPPEWGRRKGHFFLATGIVHLNIEFHEADGY